MSYNAIEAFHQQLSAVDDVNEYVCSDRQYTHVPDQNNFNYNTGIINWSSLALVGANHKATLNVSAGWAHIPYGATVHATGGTDVSFGKQSGTTPNFVYTLTAQEALLLAPKGAHHIVSQVQMRLGGHPIHQGHLYGNYAINERLKSLNQDQYHMYADVLGHAWDSSESYELHNAVLETNNGLVGSTNYASGIRPSSFANKGHVERALKSNVDLTSANMRLGTGSGSNALKSGTGVAATTVLQDSYGNALLGVWDDQGTLLTPSPAGVYACAAGRRITTLMFQYTAVLPLALISSFLAQMPSCQTLNDFFLTLETNISPSNSWTATFAAPATAPGPYTITATSSAQSVGHTCPFMLSSLSSDGSTGVQMNGATPTLNVSPFIGYYSSPPSLSTAGNLKKVNQNSLQQAQLWIPQASLTTPYLELLASNPTKRVIYEDYFQESTLTNIGPYASVQRQMTFSSSNLRKMFILPFLNTASAADPANCCDPRQRLVSSAGNTVSFNRLSNLQVSIGGINLFNESHTYDFIHYLDGAYIQQGVNNGNAFLSQSVQGQIRYSDWKRCYGVYCIDLSRVSDESIDNVVKSVQLSFKNNTPNTYDYLVLVQFDQFIAVDRVSSAVGPADSI